MEGSNDYLKEFDRIYGDCDTMEGLENALDHGDLIQISGTKGKSSCAIFLDIRNRLDILYTDKGALQFYHKTAPTFIVKNFFTAQELEPIMKLLPPAAALLSQVSLNLNESFKETVPRLLGKSFLDRIEVFQQQVEETYRKHSRNFDRAHSIVAHLTEAKTMSLAEIATKLTGLESTNGDSLPETLLMAVNNAVVRDGFGFAVMPKEYFRTRHLVVESKQTVQSIQRVEHWIRCFQEGCALKATGNEMPRSISREGFVFLEFVKKARRLIRESRKLRRRSPDGAVLGTNPRFSWTEGSKRSIVKSSPFSEFDRDFIHVLTLLSSTRVLVFHPTLRSLPNLIVRDTGMYDDVAEVDTDTIRTFLVEIGVMQPFENSEAADRYLSLPDQELDDEVEATRRQVNGEKNATHVSTLADSMQEHRKDWGTSPIFVIDSAATQEYDDGISVEDVPDSDGHLWLHSHITHLSAFLDPHGVFSRLAARHLQSNYYPDARIPMLPSWLVRRFSLRKDSPVITFSGRIDKFGNLVDYKVQPGIARNIVVINKDQIKSFFGYSRQSSRSSNRLSVGQRAPIGGTSDHGDDTSAKAFDFDVGNVRKCLEQLFEVTKRLDSQIPKTPLNAPLNIGKAEVVPNKSADPLALRLDRKPQHAQFNLTQPSISLLINCKIDTDLKQNFYAVQDSARMIVTQAMLLSGQIAARWADDRNIPIPFSGSKRSESGGNELPVLREQYRQIMTGEIPFSRDLVLYIRNRFAVRHVSDRPIPLVPLGFTHYTKITSPLRRYYDLLGLWQIDAALREEYRTGKSLAQTSSTASDGITSSRSDAGRDGGRPDYLPFDRPEMIRRIHAAEHRGTAIEHFENSHRRHWALLAFARMFYLGEGEFVQGISADPSEAGPTSHISDECPPARPTTNTLPDRFSVIFTTGSDERRSGRLELLELPCDTEDISVVQEGERWECSVVRVRLQQKRVVVKPIRKLS